MATNLKLIPRAERLLEGKITADMTDSQTTVTVDNPPLITALPSYLEIDPDSSTYRELCRVIAVSSSTITLERGLNNGGTGFPHSNNTAYKFKFTSRHWEAVATALESGYLTEDSSYVFTQVSTSSFKITASSVDRTDKYTQGRRVRLNGSVVTRIVSSSYSNPDTTVVVEGTSVPAVITTVEIELTTEGNTNVFIPYDYIDTDDTLTANSDTKLPSQKAVKTYADTKSDASKKETLIDKRINPRIVTAASYTTDTGTALSVATCDEFDVTAQAGALKLNNPGGTPVNGQKLIIRIKDDSTPRALTYDTQYRAVGVTLPTTTVASKTTYIGLIFNSTDTKWDCIAVTTEE